MPNFHQTARDADRQKGMGSGRHINREKETLRQIDKQRDRTWGRDIYHQILEYISLIIIKADLNDKTKYPELQYFLKLP